MAMAKVSMKLLIDVDGRRVLFAEAGKDCVDFLFYILSLPMSTLIRLLGKQGMVGSIANLYESFETLNDSYIQPNITKETLLKPAAPLSRCSVPLLALAHTDTVEKFIRCNYCSCNRQYYSDDPRAVCKNCNRTMTSEMSYVAPPVVEESNGGGFVKGVVTYMVMDDLVVKPMSTISSITLLNKFNVKDVGSLQEKVVTLGTSEAVKLLKTSLESNMVLTNVFLQSDFLQGGDS